MSRLAAGPLTATLAACGLAATGGCGLFAGLSDFDDREPATAAATTGAASSSTSTSDGSGGGSGGRSGDGAGGDGSTSTAAGGGSGGGCSEDCPIGACDEDGCRNDLLWKLQAGDIPGGGSDQQIHAIAFSGGDLVLTGTFLETLDILDGFATSDPLGDVFLARVAADGSPSDGVSFAASGFQLGEALVALPNGDLAIGGVYDPEIRFGSVSDTSPTFTARAFFARLSSGFGGAALETFGGTEALELADWRTLRAGPGGEVLGSGVANLDVDYAGCAIGDGTAGGNDAFFTIASTADATCRSLLTIGGPGDQVAGPLLADGASRYLVVSSTSGPTLLGPATLTEAKVPCVVVADDALGNADKSLCLETLNPPDAVAVDAALGPSHTIYVSGWHRLANVRPAPFVARLDMGASALVWERSLGNGEEADFEDVASRVAVHADGRLRVVVAFSGTVELEAPFGNLVSRGKKDALVVEIDPQGNVVSYRQIGGPDDDIVTSIAIGDDDRVCVGGYFSEEVDLGGATLTAAAKTDAFVACYDGR